MVGSVRLRSLALTLGVAALVGPAVVSAAPVEPKVTQVVNGGSLMVSIADASMQAVNYSHEAGSSTGTLVISVNDMRGTSEGWDIYLSAGDFAVTQSISPNAVAIPNDGFAITSVDEPSVVAGQAIGQDGPSAQIDAVGSLDVVRSPLSAGAGAGSGSYTQEVDVSLAIPAMTQTGTYTSTLTVSTNAAP
jgi:hypothetical protein